MCNKYPQKDWKFDYNTTTHILSIVNGCITCFTPISIILEIKISFTMSKATTAIISTFDQIKSINPKSISNYAIVHHCSLGIISNKYKPKTNKNLFARKKQSQYKIALLISLSHTLNIYPSIHLYIYIRNNK